MQRLAVKNYQLRCTNPPHPSLAFRSLQGKGNLITVRIGDHHRVRGELESDTVTWVWIGTYAEYESNDELSRVGEHLG